MLFKPLGLLCAAACLGSVLLLCATPASAQPHSELFGGNAKPEKLARDAAATTFLEFLDAFNSFGGAKDARALAARQNHLISSLSMRSRRQLQGEDVVLLIILSKQWQNARPATISLATQTQTPDTATIVTAPTAKAGRFPLLLRREAGAWGVDVMATYAKWNGLPATATLAQVRANMHSNPVGAQVFGRIAENARRASCQSNLKQIALSVMQYSSDHDEKYPPAKNWIDAIFPYVKTNEIFNCPALAKGQKYGYALNSNLSGQSMANFDDPARTTLIYETTVLKRNAFGIGQNRANRHLGGANFAYADGHVKWVARAQLPSFKLKP